MRTKFALIRAILIQAGVASSSGPSAGWNKWAFEVNHQSCDLRREYSNWAYERFAEAAFADPNRIVG